MNREKLISRIAKKEFDREGFVDSVISSADLREAIVRELLTNQDIMVYYHCYYVVSDASEKKPELFYEYWPDFVALLDHKNSYHRDIGLTIIANLVRVDSANGGDRLSAIWEQYLSHLNDERFMTGQCCLRNLKKVLKTRNDLVDKVVTRLLSFEKISSYSQKQIELVKSEILEIFDEVFEISRKKDEILDFVRNAAESISPKTKKRAKQFMARAQYLK